ncbi:MAG: hypothetical protein KJO31_07815 [Gammaproteobacteria bacterium]|nr:hypothetical protein [Gammaproteobacteria bacterium]
MVEELIPIVMFIVVGAIFWLFYFFRHRNRAEIQQTIRLALEKGQDLSPELIEKLGDAEPNSSRDLRRGLIWLALAVALALCGVFVPDPSGHALRGCLAGAAFPLSIGIAFMIMWRYGENKSQQG